MLPLGLSTGMVHGLLWLPLLALFLGLAYAGWYEYEKLEAYKRWAVGFERAKYDVYGVLGQTGETLVWAKPTRQGPIELGRTCLGDLRAIELRVGDRLLPLDQADLAGQRGQVCLELIWWDDRPSVRLPFTELDLARRWGEFLRSVLPEGV